MRFHTSLPVLNIPETVAFYRVLFASEPVKTKPDYAKFLPTEVDLNISFHESAEGVEALRTVHLGFEVEDQASLERMHARLVQAGLLVDDRETSVCCYALQDKLWIEDPSGYRWEIYRLIEDTERKMAPETTCCGPSRSESATGGCC